MKKWLICVMSLLLFFGFSGSVLAVDDNGGTPGDSVVAGYDIGSADVVVYPPDANEVEDYMNVCLGMENGSSLPGMVIMEFDVDDNTATGGNVAMTGIFNPCAGGGTHGGKIKKQAGIDIVIMAMLRAQSDSAATAWCDECKGSSGQCSTRGPECTTPACDQPPCYTTGEGCAPGDLDCFEIGDECTDGLNTCMSGLDKCFKMDVLCDDCVESCAMGRIIGEWYVTAAALGIGGGKPQERGRIDLPLPRGTDADDSDCYKFPWRRIVEATHADLTAVSEPKIFSLAAAKNSANLKWQVSTWYQTDTPCTDPAGPCDDFFAPGNCAEVTDVVPNTDGDNMNSSDMASASETDGGHCHRLQNRFDLCFDLMANGSEMDYNTCKGLSSSGQTVCQDAGCTWWENSPTQAFSCMLDIPIMDWDKVNLDGVGAIDFGIFKREQGRSSGQ